MRRRPQQRLRFEVAVGEIRATIVKLVHERDSARHNAGVALVSQREVRGALQRQRACLETARLQIEKARESVTDAARGAEADGVDAEPFRRAADGLVVQRAVVDLNIAELEGLHDVAVEHAQRARELLRTATRTLDAALREQLRLLAELERLEREQIRRDARSERRPPG